MNTDLVSGVAATSVFAIIPSSVFAIIIYSAVIIHDYFKPSSYSFSLNEQLATAKKVFAFFS